MALARVALTRLDLRARRSRCCSAAACCARRPRACCAAIADGLRAVGPAIAPRVVAAPPIVGAALLGLDELGAEPAAYARARAELEPAPALAMGAADG